MKNRFVDSRQTAAFV